MGQFKFFRGVLKPVLSDLKQQTMVRHQNGRTSRVLVPKEQPPRKLSGQRTDAQTKTLESGTQYVPAEGITISGERTEGASPVKTSVFVVMWCRKISKDVGSA